MQKRTILIAGMGTSPAVLTETVWALAHRDKPVVPDEIVVLVTMSGKDRLCRELLSGDKSVWGEMLASLKEEKIPIDGKLLFGDTSIRVIPDEKGNGAWDLRSGEDNLRAADFMLRQIRQYTEATDTVVLASIAGGRKTMSALLFSCMSLLGREDDKVFHVLLPPEFEGGVEPPMYYPKKGVTYTNLATGKKYKGDKFHSELFEVPFVRMRGWYQEKFKSIPPSYRTLVSQVQSTAPAAVVYPEIEIDAWNGTVKVGGVDVHVGAAEFATLIVLACGIPKADVIYRRLYQVKVGNKSGCCDWIERFLSSSTFVRPYEKAMKLPDRELTKVEVRMVERERARYRRERDQEVSKSMSRIRKAFEKAGVGGLEALVPCYNRPVTFPLEKIGWKNRNKIEDICGYLFSSLQTEESL